MSGTLTTGQAKISPAAQNAAARNNIFNLAKPIFQRVTTKTFSPPTAGNATLVVNPLQIGFLRRFVVEVTATITNTGGTNVLNLTPNGADNLITNLTFNDFTGNPRHNASGRAFSFVEAAKYRRIPGAALASDSNDGFGSIIASNTAPATIAAGAASTTISRVFEIPIMVDTGRFMAGGMWLGVNNQSTLLTINFNTNPVGVGAADPLNYIYTNAAGTTGSITSLTATVYQDYWNFGSNLIDPKTGLPLLPMDDVSTAYMITENNSGMTFAVGQPSSWNYPTFSKVLGTYFEFDNGGALNPGTDWSTLSLVVSNYSIIKQYSPHTLDRLTRDVCGASFPAGCYPIFSRMHPLDVAQYPSLQLQFTPSSVSGSPIGLITTELLRPIQYMSAASGVGGV